MEKKIETKKPRSIVISDNWKQKEIQKVLSLRDEMIEHNIDKLLIKKYVDEQYNIINKKYEEKVQKYYQKQSKNNEQIEQIKQTNKKKREKAVDFLIKNKTFLEENGVNQKYIQNYVETQYNYINKTYDNTNIDTKIINDDVNLSDVNFID